MVPEFMCERHQCGRSPEPDGTVRGQRTPTVHLAAGDLWLSENMNPSASRPLASTRVWRPPCVKFQLRLRNSQFPAEVRDDLPSAGVVDSDLVEHEQHIGIRRELEHPCPVPTRRPRSYASCGDRYRHDNTVSQPYDIHRLPGRRPDQLRSHADLGHAALDGNGSRSITAVR